MNSVRATAASRVGIRIQDIETAARNIMRCTLNRTKLWLLVRFLPVCILTCLSVHSAHANGVSDSISNGGIKYGTVTGTGYDTYTFSSNSSTAYIFATIAETGTHDTHFSPRISIYNPSGTLKAHPTSPIRTYASAYGASGTWSIKVDRTDGYSTGGNYALHVVQFTLPHTYSITPPNLGSMMYPSTTYNGTIEGSSADRGNIAIYSFEAVPNTYTTINYTASGGNTQIVVFKPSGTVAAHAGGYSSGYTIFYSSATTDTYTLLVYRADNTDSSTTFTVSSSNIAMPEDAKSDGTICIPCEMAKASGYSPDLAKYVAQSLEVGSTGQAAVADPINIATGNLVETVTDYTTVGTNPLALTRTYNSMSYTRGLFPTLMGVNWRTNYDRYIREVSSTQVAAERPDGRVVNFTLVGSTWTPDTDVDMTLTKSGSTYTLTDSNDVVETYSVSSGQGFPSSIAWPDGYTQTLTWSGAELSSVSDSYSRELDFTYTSGVLTGVTTPDSATLTYDYTTVNGNSLLDKVTYNTSTSTNQTYLYENSDLPYALTGITDENGNRYATWTYDGAGRCTSSKLGDTVGANYYQVSYDDSTGDRTVTGPLGNEETYQFTTSQDMQKVSEIDRTANSPVASVSRYFTYDTNGYLATATDWDGNSTHWTNNSHGLPTEIVEGYGSGVARTTDITYDSTWVHKPYTITKDNLTIDDRYDSTQGTLLTRTLTDSTGGSTNGQTHVWTYTYNGTGELLTVTNPRTDHTLETTYTYSSGALASITDALGNVTTINSANGTGQPTEITDPNSVVTDFTYDNRNRLLTKTVDASPSNEETQYSWTASGQLSEITLPDSSTISFAYDNAHRLTTVTNTAGETINYTLNAAGKPTETTIKNASGTTKKDETATYDVLADMLTRVGAGGSSQTTSYAYDGNMNRTSITDANSQEWQQAYDALNRATTVTDPDSHTAAPTYNDLDYVTAQTDFNGYSTTFARDGFGNAIERSSPDTGTADFTYDEDNNMTESTDARGVEADWTYDKLDRPTAESFPSYSSEDITWTYDETSGGNKGIGHLTSFSDESGSTTLKYDNFGNMTESVQTIGSNTYTTDYSYDLANRVTQIVYPSGRIVNYTYDSSGYLTQVDTKPNSMGSDTVLASSITHKPFGPVDSFTYGNSEALTQTFDSNYWLTNLTTSYSGTDLQNLDFGYDDAGNLTSITDNVNSARDETYTVDDLDRLHTASGAYGSRTYTYDDNSNRSTWSDGTITRTTTFSSSSNLVSSISDGTNTRNFTWTASGNLATDDRVMDGGLAVSNTYGGRDRLESMTVNSQPITFAINALGQRVQKATVSATTDYTYDIHGNMIAESDDSTGSAITEYVYMEGIPLAQIDSSGNIYYLHTDQTGNPQKITDSSRTLVWDREQEPFGEDYSTPTNTTPTNLRFPGQYADTENLLSYNMNRDYDATLGRYIEADPTGFIGGLNLYGYAGANPTQHIDPLGLDWVYFQSSGTIAHYNMSFSTPPSGPVSVPNGPTPNYVSSGYSGHGQGLNNPAMQNVNSTGPIPQGLWAIEAPYYNRNTGPYTMNLVPSDDTNTYGRDLFRIHGDNSAGDHSASQGCIVAHPDTRHQIGHTLDYDDRLWVAP